MTDRTESSRGKTSGDGLRAITAIDVTVTLALWQWDLIVATMDNSAARTRQQLRCDSYPESAQAWKRALADYQTTIADLASQVDPQVSS